MKSFGFEIEVKKELFWLQEGGAVLFGETNPNSVMSYKFPPVIQKTDKETVRRLYKLRDGDKIQNFLVDKVAPNN